MVKICRYFIISVKGIFISMCLHHSVFLFLFLLVDNSLVCLNHHQHHGHPHKKTGHLETHGHPFQRHGHLLQRYVST